ncbi:SH3 domain-binding protein 5-like [Paramacrobiotus metropolitanus]|uniref:SH3 domain-binding protein 5-like n=1 Tax=Paramacrobiotus metropolitanus TaxID=2943436 RepID=UPI0024464056|nr:SH3 domain-binding protein 5-like [Paramacrobiotus metropolitanus]
MFQPGDVESLKSSDSASELEAPEFIDNSLDGDDIDNDTEHLDPRVQGELEKLNEAAEAINRLEKQLDEAKAAGRQAFYHMTHTLHDLNNKLGKCVQKSRPYYEARADLKKAQTELQHAALLFEKSNAGLKASKEIVKLTEEGLVRQGGKLDETWQEMLNYATKKVTHCEVDLRQRQREHWHASKLYTESEEKVKALEKKFKSSINKSKPYYELRAQMNHFVEKEKFKVRQLERSISQAKITYADGLANLEGISEQIHLQRRMRDELLAQRDSGCGTISDSHSFTDSLDLTSLSDGPAESIEAVQTPSERHQMMLDTLHDIICHSKGDNNGTDRADNGRQSFSRSTLDLRDKTIQPDMAAAAPTAVRSHSRIKNAQSFPLLTALEQELTRLQVESDVKGEGQKGAKKSLQTVMSVDSAMDSGEECELNGDDEELVNKAQLQRVM